MLPLGFMLPAVLLLLIALYVTVREGRAAMASPGAGAGPVVTALGEGMMIVGALAVFLQGWLAGLVLAPLPAFVLFFGGASLFFVGMGLESRRAARR